MHQRTDWSRRWCLKSSIMMWSFKQMYDILTARSFFQAILTILIPSMTCLFSFLNVLHTRPSLWYVAGHTQWAMYTGKPGLKYNRKYTCSGCKACNSSLVVESPSSQGSQKCSLSWLRELDTNSPSCMLNVMPPCKCEEWGSEQIKHIIPAAVKNCITSCLCTMTLRIPLAIR